jgi:hypothetical protein
MDTSDSTPATPPPVSDPPEKPPRYRSTGKPTMLPHSVQEPS